LLKQQQQYQQQQKQQQQQHQQNDVIIDIRFMVTIDNSHYRVFFILSQKVYSRKEHTKMSKITKLGCEML
jgi:5-hydroxyisourate hydrolase-like protein (transthyretin family)